MTATVLARICLVGRREPGLDARDLRDAIHRRRTDRRPFSDEPVPADADLRMLAWPAAAEGVLAASGPARPDADAGHRRRPAGANEMADPDYRNELIRWTNRPEWSHDGVPADTAVRKVPRRVPVREFVVATQRRAAGRARRRPGAAYLILHGDGGDTSGLAAGR